MKGKWIEVSSEMAITDFVFNMEPVFILQHSLLNHAQLLEERYLEHLFISNARNKDCLR